MILENNKIRIECLAEHGGKLSSIYDKENEIEFLFQNPKNSYKTAELDSNFSLFEACGFDDTFPSIDSQEVLVNGMKVNYPDHGEIWSSNMKEEFKNNQIFLELDSKILPYHYEKTFSLKENGFQIHYKIKNTGDFGFPCFYTFHCLMDSKSNIELIVPNNLDQAKIVFGSNRLENNSVVRYPITNTGINLAIPELLNESNCEKFYFTKPTKKGLIGYNYKDKKVKLLISFDESKLPYLGFWNTQGGFRDDYNFALEMSNGYYDSIDTAMKNNACPYLEKDQEFSFDINFKIESYNDIHK